MRCILATWWRATSPARLTSAAIVVVASFTSLGFGQLPAVAAGAPPAKSAPEGGFWSATFMSLDFPHSVAARSVTVVPAQIENTGTALWPVTGRSAVRVAYHWFRPDGAVAVWEGRRESLAASVPAKGLTSLQISVVAPDEPGRYELRFDLVSVPSGWFSHTGSKLPVVSVDVGTPLWSAAVRIGALPSPLFGRSAFDVPVTLTNTGSQTWPAKGSSAIQLSYHWLRSDGAFMTWDGERTALPDDVAPGEATTAVAVVDTPDTIGTFQLEVDLVSRRPGWFSLLGTPMPRTTVKIGELASQYFSAVFGISRMPSRLDEGSVNTVAVTVTNAGLGAWPNTGPSAVYLAYHWWRPNGSALIWDGRRTSLTRAMPARTSITQPLVVQAPDVPGRYRLQIDLVSNSVGWFAGFEHAGPSSDVEVQSDGARVAGFAHSPYWLLAGLLILLATGALATHATLAARRRSRVFASVAASYKATYGSELWPKDR